jgi:hypothetical protein
MIWTYFPESPRNCLQCRRRALVLWPRGALDPSILCALAPGERHPIRLDQPCFREENPHVTP